MTHARILLGIMAGAFTEVLLKYLPKINMDLEELARAVTQEMVEKYGQKQMPVIVNV